MTSIHIIRRVKRFIMKVEQIMQPDVALIARILSSSPMQVPAQMANC